MGGAGRATRHDIAGTMCPATAQVKKPQRGRYGHSAQPVEGGEQVGTVDDKGPFEEFEGDVAMKGERPEVVRGSGNAFRDLGCESADAGQFKAILAAEIIRTLDPEVSPRSLPLRANPAENAPSPLAHVHFFQLSGSASRVSAVNSYRRIRAAPALSG